MSNYEWWVHKAGRAFAPDSVVNLLADLVIWGLTHVVACNVDNWWEDRIQRSEEDATGSGTQRLRPYEPECDMAVGEYIYIPN